MQVPISIEARGQVACHAARTLLNVNTPGGCNLRLLKEEPSNRFTGEEVSTFVFLLDIGKDIAISLLASWLYERMRAGSASSRLLIKGKLTQIEKHEIERSLHDMVANQSSET